MHFIQGCKHPYSQNTLVFTFCVAFFEAPNFFLSYWILYYLCSKLLIHLLYLFSNLTILRCRKLGKGTITALTLFQLHLVAKFNYLPTFRWNKLTFYTMIWIDVRLQCWVLILILLLIVTHDCTEISELKEKIFNLRIQFGCLSYKSSRLKSLVKFNRFFLSPEIV